MSDLNDHRFASLGAPRRIWTVSAVHGDAARLTALHDALYDRFQPGDRLVYMGNYCGHGARSGETVDEILTFRRMLLALPGMRADDIVYLRGGMEEMWQKLLQVHFAPHPSAVLGWLLEHGLAPVLAAYGISAREGLNAANEGVVALTRWTNRIREAVRRRAGHEIFAMQWRRAAFSEMTPESESLLFVHAGINPAVELCDQGDSFWWAGKDFREIKTAYNPFSKVVRGYDPAHGGVYLNGVTATIDGGCGFGGNLVCAGFQPDGGVFEMLEA